MAVPTQNITLDMGKRIESRKVVYLGQGDSNGTRLVVTLTDGGGPYDATGTVATMSVPTPKGPVTFEGEVLGSSVTFAIDESLFGSASGRLRGACVILAGDGFVTSSQRFDVEVIGSVAGGGGQDDEEEKDTEAFLTDEDLDEIFGE